MVEVSLMDLVSLRNTRDIWPSEFAALMAKCEENPADRLPFGLVADWCDEHGEHEYAKGWRWLHKRPWDEESKTGVVVNKHTDWNLTTTWSFVGLPHSLATLKPHRDSGTLAGKVAALADRLAEIEREITA